MAGYSYSKLKAFSCPYRYKALYIDNRKEPKGKHAIAGGMAHDMMARYLATLYARKLDERRALDLEALGNCAAAAEEDTRWPEEASLQTRKEAAGLFNHLVNSLKMVKGGWSLFGIKDVKEFWIEQNLCFDRSWNVLPNDAWFWKEGVFFRSIIDWAFVRDNILCIVDHKSGKSVSIDELQLKIYAFCGQLALKIKEKLAGVRVFYNVLPKAKLVGGHFFDPQAVPFVREIIEEKVSTIEHNKEWGPIPTSTCSFCGFRSECPLRNAVNFPRARTAPWEPKSPWAVMKALYDIGIQPADALAAIGFTEDRLQKILKAGDAVTKRSRLDRLEEILSKTGKEA